MSQPTITGNFSTSAEVVKAYTDHIASLKASGVEFDEDAVKLEMASVLSHMPDALDATGPTQ